MSPVLAVVVESLPDHTHDHAVGLHMERVVCQLRHYGTTRTPGVVRGRLTHLGLCISIVVHYIFTVRRERGGEGGRGGGGEGGRGEGGGEASGEGEGEKRIWGKNLYKFDTHSGQTDVTVITN